MNESAATSGRNSISIDIGHFFNGLCGKGKEDETKNQQMVSRCSSSNHLQQERIQEAEERAKGIPNREWLISIQERLGTEPVKLRATSASKTCCIYRLPHCFLVHNKNGYLPQVISIGPFHRDDESLKAMQEHKWRYLRSVLSKAPDGTLDKFVVAMTGLEKRARDCYSESFNHINSKDFVEMMILDGCFIINLFCKVMELWSSDSDESDPILKTQWLLNNIVTDLFMLQNQIPFFLLQCLFDLARLDLAHIDKEYCCLTQLALHFFQNRLSYIEDITKDHSELQTLHLLHLFHSSLLPLHSTTRRKKKDDNDDDDPGKYQLLPCVTQLQEAGIKFEKAKKDHDKRSLLDISFKKDEGVIVIPSLSVDDCTNSLFLNLIAFEQCYNHCRKYITSYTFFIDKLINTAKDVEALCRGGIINNYLDSDEDVADVFNKMGKEVSLDPDDFYVKDVCEEIIVYYNSTLHVWRANLMHNYFNSPWTIISVIAAIFLLLLTVIQAVFSIYPNIK